ncbi:MAG: DUF3343 domain-containing protein [Nitrospinota bacterium]
MGKAFLEQTLIAVFISTHETLRAEKFFKKCDMPFKPVIKPRGISSRCQMGLRFSPENLEILLEIVSQNGLALTGVYEKRGDAWEKATLPDKTKSVKTKT